MTTPYAPWPFKPDWTNTITETLSWKTSVLRSRLGAEQRRQLRTTPRRTIEFPIQLYAQERAYFDAFMMSNAGRQWWVPIPHESVEVGRPLQAGDTVIPMDTAGREFAIGSMVVVVSGAFVAEVTTVTALYEGGIGIEPLAKAHLGFSMVSPALLCMIVEASSLNRQAGSVYSGAIKFVASQTNPWPVPDRALNVLPEFLGYPVLTTEPNSRNDLAYTYAASLSVIDNDVGIPRYVDQTNRIFPTQKYEFFLVGRKERSDFRDLIYQLRGQAQPIWVPTFNDDLEPDGRWIDPDGRLVVLPGREHAFQTYRDGTNAIITPSAGGDPGTSLYSETVLRTSFMSLKRLGVDDIEFVHYGTHDGLTTASVLFNDAPDLRMTLPYYQVPLTPVGPFTQPPLDVGAPVLISGKPGGH